MTREEAHRRAIEAGARALCRTYYTEKDTCTLIHVEELIETEWPEWVPEITAAITAAEPFIAARSEAAVLAEREAILQSLPGGTHCDPQEIADAIRARGGVE